jgi:enamine deaminase RidA (YjgF/YER057c/UK114 family)
MGVELMDEQTLRRVIDSGTPWERRVGYARAVRVGRLVFVSGTLGTNDRGELTDPSDPYLQSIAALEKIEAALHQAGAGLADVVRTRMFVTRIGDLENIGAAHRRFFGEVRPCATMVEVSRLALPDALVEIEVDAVIGGA